MMTMFIIINLLLLFTIIIVINHNIYIFNIFRNIAKLCALTLCNLSNEIGGEKVMAKEGAVLALVILLGVRNQRLAPVCVQALHNLTCVENHFKGMERIIKALLNLPPLPTFDATPYVVRALVNCSRFAWLRMRIIEDGALQTFTAFVNTLSHRDNREELVHYMSVCLRQLSDSAGCRVDMISKGSVEMIPQLLPYCEEKTRLLIMKALHNLLGVVPSFPTIIFDMAVNVVVDMVLHSDNFAILQYASSCFYVFTKERMRGISRLTIRMLKTLPKLLTASDPLTQFFSVITSANMFFQDLWYVSITLITLIILNYIILYIYIFYSSQIQSYIFFTSFLNDLVRIPRNWKVYLENS